MSLQLTQQFVELQPIRSTWKAMEMTILAEMGLLDIGIINNISMFQQVKVCLFYLFFFSTTHELSFFFFFFFKTPDKLTLADTYIFLK